MERKIRNRAILGLSVLGLVNAWVFCGTDSGFKDMAPAAMSEHRGPLPPLADPPEHACGGDAIRIFAGLESMLPLETALRGGLTLRLALLSLGIDADEIDRLEVSVRSKVDLGLLGGSGAPVRVAVDRLGGVQALEIEISEGHLLQACREGDEFQVRNLQHPLRTDVEVLNFELGRDADLTSAVIEAGETETLARWIAETLAGEVDFLTEGRPGDTVTVMVEKRWLGRSFHRYGAIVAVRFRGSRRRATLVRYQPEGGTSGFFSLSGEPAKRRLRRSPVGYFSVNPEARGLLAPSVEVLAGNLGAVYRLPTGAPLVALGDGVIRQVGHTVEEGHYIDLELRDGMIARYCNLMRTVGELRAGQEIVQGQMLALAGHSGRTPYDRLRLELWVEREGDMKTVDPLLPTAEGDDRSPVQGEPIPAGVLEAFKDDVAPQLRALRLVR